MNIFSNILDSIGIGAAWMMVATAVLIPAWFLWMHFTDSGNWRTFRTMAVITTIFQVFHLLEHGIQMFQWTGDHSTTAMYNSRFATGFNQCGSLNATGEVGGTGACAGGVSGSVKPSNSYSASGESGMISMMMLSFMVLLRVVYLVPGPAPSSARTT